jgi:hypothetical protein
MDDQLIRGKPRCLDRGNTRHDLESGYEYHGVSYCRKRHDFHASVVTQAPMNDGPRHHRQDVDDMEPYVGRLTSGWEGGGAAGPQATLLQQASFGP